MVDSLLFVVDQVVRDFIGKLCIVSDSIESTFLYNPCNYARGYTRPYYTSREVCTPQAISIPFHNALTVVPYNHNKYNGPYLP